MNRHELLERVRAVNPIGAESEPLPALIERPPPLADIIGRPGLAVPFWKRRRGWQVALVAAAVSVVLIGGIVLLAGAIGGEPPVGTVPTPTTTDPPLPEAGGVITVEITGLSGALGKDLAGVLLAYDPTRVDGYRWDGVGGFAVAVDADPFSTSQVLGEVDEAYPADPNDDPNEMWPWASGEAKIPAGDYTLWLWAGHDLCCYTRWVPGESSSLEGCELRLSTNGQDQTIHVTDIPSDGGPCVTDPATAVTGTLTLSVQNLAGMAGYRLLAAVWDETADRSLVGGALWTHIDTDNFTDVDRVHPPAFPNPRSVISEFEGWVAEDYLWSETAQLEPGRYQVVFWANPGELAPFGSHIPAAPIERSCSIDVDITAGTNTTVTITAIPAGGELCPLASDGEAR